ncbi:hypothetical protein F8M41_001764 [Gigaspora margarita]|uniref:Uncharacterized protein n=1 Tax=Gigaspora margarita TaxID=4874 RepID=A0A8H4A7V1_GIGMA|nr:hypothetical protein F8M41_001764 [Gigaspora margarita]
MVNELKSAGVELAPVLAGMVRQNLRGINTLSTKYKYNQLIKLLVFILENEDYEDLDDIYLIPLYNIQWNHQHFQIKNVVHPKSELILLNSKNPLLELPKSDMSHVEKLVNILQNLGIRFTDRSWDVKLVKSEFNNALRKLTVWPTAANEYDDNYFNFIKSILTSSNFHEIKNWIESKPVVPNRSNKKLKTVRDLYDHKTYLFRITFKGTGMGFKYQVNRQAFLECARAIQKQSQKQRYQHANDLIYHATTVVHYLYNNIDDLNYSDAEYEDLAHISFIPAELSIKLLILKKLLNLMNLKVLIYCVYPTFTQVALFHSAVISKPSSPILTKYKKFRKPNGNQILEHLHVVAFKLLKSKK